jgi:DNA-binding ferritin-like protein (Dps family)
LLSGIVDFFTEGAASGKAVTELIGTDVAAFADGLIKGSRTYADVYQESLSGKPGAAHLVDDTCRVVYGHRRRGHPQQ